MESTRVRLPVDDRSGRGDYINANYISVGVRPGGKEYISTQGPLPETVIDFWRMVLHTRSTVIVMVTPLQEGGRVRQSSYRSVFVSSCVHLHALFAGEMCEILARY